jgi:hypothetical protein
MLPCPHCGHRMVITAAAPARYPNGAESNDLEDITQGCVQAARRCRLEAHARRISRSVATHPSATPITLGRQRCRIWCTPFSSSLDTELLLHSGLRPAVASRGHVRGTRGNSSCLIRSPACRRAFCVRPRRARGRPVADATAGDRGVRLLCGAAGAMLTFDCGGRSINQKNA